MNTFLACSDNTLSSAVRRVLSQNAIECPSSRIFELDEAESRMVTEPGDLILVVMPGEPEAALTALHLLETLPRGDGTRIVAIGPIADSRVVIRALRGLVDDYIDENELESELTACIAQIRKANAGPPRRGRVVAFLAPRGGSGSSTLAANVAAALARADEPVALLDFKRVNGDLTDLLNLKPDYTLADLCRNRDRIDLAIFESILAPHPAGIRLLASPRDIDQAGLLTAETIRLILAMTRSSFDLAIVDVDPGFRDEDLLALREADTIALVLRLDFSSLRQTLRTLDFLERREIPRTRVELVVNSYGRPRELPYAKAEAALGMKIKHFIPDEPRTINPCNDHGTPAVLDAPRTKVSKALIRLAESIGKPTHRDSRPTETAHETRDDRVNERHQRDLATALARR